MLSLFPKCGSPHVARLLDDDTKIDIAFACRTCGFEYSVPTIPEIEMESQYDADNYHGQAIEIHDSHYADKQ